MFTVLQHGWRHSLIELRQHLYVLGQLAYKFKDYTLAEEAYQALIDNPQHLEGEGLEREIQDAKYWVDVCERLAESQKYLSQKPSKSPQKKQKKLPETPLPPEKSAQEELPRKEEAPEEDFPELKIEYEIDETSLLELIQARRATDPAMLDLTLNA